MKGSELYQLHIDTMRDQQYVVPEWKQLTFNQQCAWTTIAGQMIDHSLLQRAHVTIDQLWAKLARADQKFMPSKDESYPVVVEMAGMLRDIQNFTPKSSKIRRLDAMIEELRGLMAECPVGSAEQQRFMQQQSVLMIRRERLKRDIG